MTVFDGRRRVTGRIFIEVAGRLTFDSREGSDSVFGAPRDGVMDCRGGLVNESLMNMHFTQR